MKTIEELNALKEEVETLNSKLADLSREELEQVTGGENKPSEKSTDRRPSPWIHAPLY